MQFHYSAKAMSGNASAGLIEADSVGEARRQLREQGLFVLSLNTQDKTNGRDAGSVLSFGKKRVRKADLLTFTSQLSIMCQSGVDLAEALHSLAEQCSHPALKKTLQAVDTDVSSGEPFSVALKKQSHVFSGHFAASIAAAEASGTMTDVLSRLASLMRNDIRLQSTLRAVLAYPIVLMGVAMLVMSTLVFFVLPQFSEVFADMGKPAPPTTQLLLDAAALLRGHLFVVAGTVLFFLAIVWKYCRTDRAMEQWDALVLMSPILRKATQPLMVGRVFRLLGTILASGVPLLEGLELCCQSMRNRHYRRLFNQLKEDVMNGRGVADTFQTVDFIPPGAVQMVSTAEQTGRLGSVLQTVGEFYEDDGERQVQQLAKLLEPAIIIVMGGIVAFVVLSIMLPLLDVSTMSH